MNKRELADHFSHDVDNLLREAGLTDPNPTSPEYEEMLKLAGALATTDFSQESRVRRSLRRRLLSRGEAAPVITAEIPGPLGVIKNILKSGQRQRPRPVYGARPRTQKLRLIAALAGVIIAVLVFASSARLQVSQELAGLLARVLFQYQSEADLPGELVLQWQFRGEDGLSSPPVAANGLIYAGGNTGYLYALEAQTGQEVWRFQTGSEVNLAPAVASGALYAASKDGDLYALDSNTGLEKWRLKLNDQFSAGPIVASDTVYIGTNNGYLYALDSGTAQEKWRFKAGNAILSSSGVAGKTLYLGSQDRHLYAIDTESGREKWRFKAGDWISASPIEVGGVVYVGSHDENLYVLDAETGQEKWRYKTGGAVGASVALAESVLSSATLAEGVIYFGSYDSYLHAVDTETGQEKWRFKMGKQTRSQPIVVGGVVYIGSGDGYLYGIDAQTGQEIGRYEADSQIYTAPVVVGDAIYFVSGKGKLYAVRKAPLPSAEEQPETRVDVSTKDEPPSFQFTPGGWYISGQDEVIRFRGRMIDGAGKPVNGFSIQADNGARSILSPPSGPNRQQPKASDGEWEIVISDGEAGTGWWWLTAVRDECTHSQTDFDPECQKFTRLSESVKVEVVYPGEMVIHADWTCHWDCQNLALPSSQK